MDCPRCRTTLTAEPLNENELSFEIDKCHNCGGIWFDSGELAKIDKIIEPTMLEIRKIPNKTEQLKPLYCPSCSNHPRLKKAEHPRDKKVIVDYCPTCKGIWLDKGELEAIQKENWGITIGKIFKWLIGHE
ncbi:zf-TFIIB domain-containing protein [Marinilabilia sp.]|uniref:TFIIB-type zinc ribbon-containing protein n=1 Tax=Marinilabilia sp. TaxID=2021252 RepID=UPI0025B9DB19|nr:zf-TFIIB domain-containing protein [Marinilabilia sp.]